MTYGKYIAWKIGLIVIFLLVAAAIFFVLQIALGLYEFSDLRGENFMRFITGVVCFFIDGYVFECYWHVDEVLERER